MWFWGYRDSAGSVVRLDHLKGSSNPDDFRILQDTWALSILPGWQYIHITDIQSNLDLLHPQSLLATHVLDQANHLSGSTDIQSLALFYERQNT